MAEETKKTEPTPEAKSATAEKPVPADKSATGAKIAPARPRDSRGRTGGPRSGGPGGGPRSGGRGPRGGGRDGGRRGGRRGERVRPEFDQKIVNIRRVTRVVAGGRRFAFSVALIAGDRNGRIGVGVGKASDTALAIEKAFKNAKRNMVRVNRTKTKSIAHEVETKYNSSTIFLKPSPGRGIVAGSSVRTVLDLAGVTDVISKIQTRSKNKINIARATVQALSQLPVTTAPADKK